MAAAVQQNEIVYEFASNCMEEQQLGDPSIFPAVIVEQVPNADLLQDYSGLACNNRSVEMIHENSLDVAEEQIIEEEDITITVEASCQNGDETMETIEAAEALLNMDSPNSVLDEKRITHVIVPSPGEIIATPVTQISVIADGMPEVLEVHHVQETQVKPVAHQSELPKKKKVRKQKPPRPESPNTPHINVKRKSKDGKGNTLYLWEFLIALLQDKSTCPRYIKWTQKEKGIFKLVDSKAVSRLWGKHKNKPDMNYETMGRALRYYYQRGILAKVEGQRLVYQFKEMPKDLVYIDDEDPSYVESCEINVEHSNPGTALASKTSLSSKNTATKQRGRYIMTEAATLVTEQSAPTDGALNVALNNKGGKSVKTLELIQQHHLPVVSAEMLRTLQTLQSLQAGQHGSVFRTMQILENLQNTQELGNDSSQGTALITMPGESFEVKSASQIPVVVAPGGQQLHTVTLQALPVSSVISSSEASPTVVSSPKIFLSTITPSQPLTLVKENIGLPSPVTELPTSPLLQKPSPSPQPILQACYNGSVPEAAAAATPVVTFAAGGQQLVSHPPGTVIASVIKAPESKQTVLHAQVLQSKESESPQHPQYSVLVFNEVCAQSEEDS
uniref:E74 like ETS transcription factor 1 n=1 Tax=Erpetoichthys calabaricus TaxID=27687 RepID=A0A8C4TDZ3_ERPCA